MSFFCLFVFFKLIYRLLIVMNLLHFYLFVIATVWSFHFGESSKCFDNEKQQVETHFATKTPYRVIQNNNVEEIKFNNCEPTRIWMLIRHGTRNPGAKFITNMKTEYTKIRDKIVASRNSQLCDHELDELRNWHPTLLEEEEKFLLMEGEDELLELAERMQLRFPTLLNEEYDNSTYRFKYTATQRTKESFRYFATGLFGRDNLKQIWVPEPMHRDPILRFYKLCSKWRVDVDKNPDTLVEIEKFALSDVVNKTVEKIRERCGINDLTTNNAHFFYQMCAYESAANRRKLSPWCALFDKKSMTVFEYLQDMEYYWYDGYGHEITYQQACPAFIDMLTRLDPDSPEPQVTAYFSHSGTMLKMLSFLRLYKDELPLTYTGYNENRKWRTSKIDAFGSNLAFVHFNCTNGSHILTMHQERIVRMPGCSSDLCDMKTLKRLFRKEIENCDFEQICYVPKIKSTTTVTMNPSSDSE